MKIGVKAPGFTLPDQNKINHSLSDYLGKRVVLYFYPKDMTPGCTIEACGFRDNIEKIKQLNALILGVSADSTQKHKQFEQKHELSFPLLADIDKSVSKAYGAYGKKKFLGKTFEGIVRKTFIIDEKGTIVKIFEKVNVKDHAQEVVAFLSA